MTTQYPEELIKEKKALERGGAMHWLHWTIVGLSLVLTFSAWYISKESIHEKIALQFDRQAKQVIELVQERMEKYEDGLWGGVAAIAANGGNISYKKWMAFADTLRIDSRYPGINGIGVIHYISPNNMATYLAQQRKDRPRYRVHPKHKKNEFWPITYIEPAKNNAKAVGLDMAHESNRYTAAVKARNTGTAKITGPITLVQDTGKTPGFLFYAPFYRGGFYHSLKDRVNNFVGLVYEPFVMKKLIEGTLQKEKRHVSIKISDNGEVLYNENTASNPDHDPHPLFDKKFELDLYGRTWTFDVQSALSFRLAHANNQPMIILIGGIIIDTLLLVLFMLLAQANRRSIKLVNNVMDYEA